MLSHMRRYTFAALGAALALFAGGCSSSDTQGNTLAELGAACNSTSVCASNYCDPFTHACAEKPGYMERCAVGCRPGLYCRPVVTSGGRGEMPGRLFQWLPG